MIFGPDDLRALADCDARAGEPLGKALRWAADEIERLRAAQDDYSWLDVVDGAE
jgi:hypothetical protein